MNNGAVDTIAALEAAIGKAPPAINLKVIDHLDESALHWLSEASLAFLTFGKNGQVAVTPAGGVTGFAKGTASELIIPLANLDEPALAEPSTSFGSLFLAPGIGETLRINGHVSSIIDSNAHIAVEECYVHCAKALIRSDFWNATPLEQDFPSAGDLVAASRFMALATMDAVGGGDLSPKGDPAGQLAQMRSGHFLFAERPGNRRADSYRNIIAQPQVAAVLLVPGLAQVATITGTARLTTSMDERSSFAVREKVPLLVAVIDEPIFELQYSSAIARAALWPLGGRAKGINPASMFAAHVRLNKDKGLAARIAGAVMAVPGLMQRGLDKDYKSNLY